MSFVDRCGYRVLVGPNQSRFFRNAREDAEKMLEDFVKSNTEDRLKSIFGPQAIGTFRVDAFRCYQHGDACGVYVEDETETIPDLKDGVYTPEIR
jgi:hypothetical protein